MEEQSELGERPRATVLYCAVASFLSVPRRTGRWWDLLNVDAESGFVPAPDPRRLD